MYVVVRKKQSPYPVCNKISQRNLGRAASPTLTAEINYATKWLQWDAVHLHPNCPFPLDDLHLYLIHISLDRPNLPSQTASRQGRGQGIMFGGGLSPGHRERGSASIYWGWGQSPQWGSRGKVPPPWSWKLCSIWRSSGGAKFDTFACFIETLMFISRKFGGAELVVFGRAKRATLGGGLAPQTPPCPRPCNLDLLEQEIVSGSGICWAICKSAPHPRQPCQHPTTQFFTGRMPFLTPNQQRQSTVH